MAPPRGKSAGGITKEFRKLLKYIFNKYANIAFVKSLLFDPSKVWLVTYLILIVELFLNIVIIQRVNYTEIDWRAYMQECEGFLNGTTNYSSLKGICLILFFAKYALFYI